MLLLCASWASTADAAPFDLTWTAPEGCPSRQEVVAATRDRLGESETTAPPELFVRGTVLADKGRFVVSFVVQDATGVDVGEREVHVQGQSCRAIEGPAALVLATMISVVRPRAETSPKPHAVPREPGAAPEEQGDAAHPREPILPTHIGPPDRAPAALRPSPAPEPKVAPAPPSPPSRRALGVAAVGSAGILPRAGAGVALRASYLHRSVLFIGIESSFETGASVHAGRGDVGFQLLSGSLLTGARVVRAAAFEIVPVLAARAGVLRTTPSGFQVVNAQAHPMALAGVGALLRASLGAHLHAEALPQAELALVRDVFQAGEGRTTYLLHQPSIVAARLTVGIGYEFP